jgi:hypothetical protein
MRNHMNMSRIHRLLRVREVRYVSIPRQYVEVARLKFIRNPIYLKATASAFTPIQAATLHTFVPEFLIWPELKIACTTYGRRIGIRISRRKLIGVWHGMQYDIHSSNCQRSLNVVPALRLRSGSSTRRPTFQISVGWVADPSKP